MKRLSMMYLLCFIVNGPALWAIPSEINYQGTLKAKGLPAKGPIPMSFQLTSSDGSVPYSNLINMKPDVVNGLFAVKLNFQMIPPNTWESITPYIQVTIDNQKLGPPEKISATVYANVSNTVVNGAITPEKIAPGYGLIPSGMIAMFDTACPSGWTRFSALDNRFPTGGDIFGVVGGASTHSHTVNPHTHDVPNHVHSIDDSTLNVAIGIRNLNFDNNLVMQLGGSVGAYSSANADQWYGYAIGMAHPSPVGSNPSNVGVAGPKIEGSTKPSGSTVTGNASPGTDSQSNIPPYLTMLFCRKQ